MGWIRANLVVLIVVFARGACASSVSIGPDGIDSAGLGLTGAGIAIGQVEISRPGFPGTDSPANSNTQVVPTDVFLRDGAATPNSTIGSHAEKVASVMISQDTVDSDSDGESPVGVAIDAELYSSATNVPVLPGQPEAALSAQHVATRNGGDVRAINLSFGENTVGGAVLDGNSLLTQFVDWSANEHETLYVVAGNEGSGGIPVPTDNFNGLTVAFSRKNDGVFRKVDSFNLFTEDAVGARTSTDILAPGRNIEVASLGGSEVGATGTSFAAPHVTATVALLQEHAENQITAGAIHWNANARRHEVMKAVLMNSADKLTDSGTGDHLGMTRTVVDTNGNDWFSSAAATNELIPLHDEFGAGHLNADRAVSQFLSGEQDPDSAPVPVRGWDFDVTAGINDLNRYPIEDELRAGSFISITLAWDRIVDFDVDGGTPGLYDLGDTFEAYTDLDDVLNDLNLFLVPKDGESIDAPLGAASRSEVDSLEHLFFEIPTTGLYDILVEHLDSGIETPLGLQEYGLAWWGVAGSLAPIAGDFDGNGIVDAADLAQWEGDFGLNGESDAFEDGDSDGADFLVWQRNLGMGVPLAAASLSVPEPSSIALLLTVLVCTTLRIYHGGTENTGSL